MKRFSLPRYLFIIIIPLVVLIASFMLRSASGPFWQYADPSYIYLFNAFQIIKGHVPTDISHPGTPLQVLMAFTIQIFNLGRSPAQAINQALIDPEFYLHAVYLFLVFSSFLTSIILGVYVYYKTNDKIAALLAQLTGLSFLILPSFNNGVFPVLPVVANVSPEPLFITIMNLFNFFLLGLYFSKEKSGEFRNVILLAIVCGLGLAIKLNFFFVFLSALILVPIRKKILFITLFVISFILFTLPIIGKYPQLFSWIGDMIGHSSRYGTGSAKIIDWGSFFVFFKLMVRHYWFFIYSALGWWIWSSLCIIKDRQDRNARFTWALSFCALLHFAATAKYFSFHYLVPGFGLFSAIFPLFYLSFKNRYSILKPLVAVFIFIFISACFVYAFPYYQKLMVLSQDIHHFNDKIRKQYPGCAVIPSNTTDINFFVNDQAGLHKGNETVFRLENEDLFRLYPHSYYFFSEEVTSPDPRVESYGIWNFKQRVFGDDVLADCPCAIFIKYASDFSSYPYQVRLLDRSRYLDAFLFVNSTEKLANYLFDQAMDSFKNGNFRQALMLGLKSRQLNYEPRGQLEYFLAMSYQNLLKSGEKGP